MKQKSRRELLHTLSAVALSVGGFSNSAGAVRSDRADPKPSQQTETVTRFQQSAKLAADDGDEFDLFGSSVGLSDDGTTAVIGAHGDTVRNHGEAGTAYVFQRSDDKWEQQQRLRADDAGAANGFGTSVALSGNATTAVVGTIQSDSNGGTDASVYIFERSADSWHQQQKLLPAGGDGAFAQAAAVSGDGETVFVGSRAADPNGKLSGAGYVFEHSGEGWQQTLTPDDGGAEDRFGEAVAISRDGQTALSGAFWDNDPHGERGGSAYVFEKSEVTLTSTPTSTDTGDDVGPGFGIGTAVAGLGAGVYLLTQRLANSNTERD
ncbi:hypothetical protein BRC66_03780 [Halobacteriales archaeon QH_2_66_30]|nr:MAG: hypothetical protein BRC66_03780 [Halobacteriales archaeon QH_2_66_30]